MRRRSARRSPRCERPARAPCSAAPRVLIPFMLTGTIWGSTWFVITGQIDVPPHWAVFYRFMLATPALFVLAW
jgi:hypothetical protein